MNRMSMNNLITIINSKRKRDFASTPSRISAAVGTNGHDQKK